MKRALAAALILLPALAEAGFVDAGGAPQPELDALYARISTDFTGHCPATVRITESAVPGISQFNTRDASILISRNNARRLNTIAHETAHLCHAQISAGASTQGGYRFLDEGHAKFYGDTLSQPEADFRRIALAKTRAYLAQGQVSLALARDWPAYFGRQGKGGQLGFEAYWVGASFVLWLRERFGAVGVLRVFDEIGHSLSFNRALQAAIGLSEDEAEAQWLAFVRSSDEAVPAP